MKNKFLRADCVFVVFLLFAIVLAQVQPVLAATNFGMIVSGSPTDASQNFFYGQWNSGSVGNFLKFNVGGTNNVFWIDKNGNLFSRGYVSSTQLCLSGSCYSNWSSIVAASSISGGGSTNYVTKFTGATALGNSIIYDNGTNVGIGTTAPTDKLTVNSDDQAIGLNSSTGSNTHINFRDNGTTKWELGKRASTNNFYIYDTSIGSDVLSIKAGGNIGIGTTDPVALLNLRGYTGGTSGSAVAAYTKTMEIAGAYNQSYNTGNSVLLHIGDYSNDSGDNVYPIYVEDENNLVAFYINGGSSSGVGTAYFGGNVGIGTTAPGAKLEVNGNIYVNPSSSGTATINFRSTNGYIASGKDYSGSGTDTIQLNNNGLGVAVLYGGNVGIGTTAPGSKLDVSGGVYASGNFNTGSSYYTGNWYLNSVNWPGTGGFMYGGSGDVVFGVGAASGQASLAIDGGFQQRETGKDNYFLGNVGIGTTAPGTKLDVYDTLNLLRLYRTGNSPSSYDYISWTSPGWGPNSGGIRAGGSWAWDTQIYSNQGLSFSGNGFNGGSPSMMINTSGNVGIGTTAPGYKLDVVGSGYGIRGYGSGYGVYGSGGSYGVYGAGSSYGVVGYSGSAIAVYAYGGSYDFYANSGNPSYFKGNVGIGTGGSSYQLSVYGSNSTYAVFGYGKTTGYSQIAIGNNDESNKAFMIGYDHDNNYGYMQIGGASIGSGIDIARKGSVTGSGITVGIGGINRSYDFYVAGTAYATGSWSSSDVRWKKDITPLKNSLADVLKLQGVNYYWNTKDYPDKGFTDGKQIGLIAQDVEKVIPELVNTDSDGYKSLSYEKLTAVLVEAAKEQQKQIEDKQEQIDTQQKEIDALKEAIEKLQK